MKKRISCILLAVLLLLGVLPTAANAETDAVIGFPAAAYKATFTDVPGGKWYNRGFCRVPCGLILFLVSSSKVKRCCICYSKTFLIFR